VSEKRDRVEKRGGHILGNPTPWLDKGVEVDVDMLTHADEQVVLSDEAA
jgi:hypothetical protein